MKRTTVNDLYKKWMKNSRYRHELKAMKEEFSLATALIDARASITQEQVAQHMKITEAVAAHLEGTEVCHPCGVLKSMLRLQKRGSKSF